MRRKLLALMEKHRRIAEAGRAAATRKKDLKLALAWEEYVKEVTPSAKNIAQSADITVSGIGTMGSAHFAGAKSLVDGTEAIPAASGNEDKFWWAGYGKEAWIKLEFHEARAISRVRFSTPAGTSWNVNGHDPTDYEIIVLLGSKTVKSIPVRGGKHPGSELSANKATHWISIDFKEPAIGSVITLQFHGSSGRNWAPVIFEVEVLAIE